MHSRFPVITVLLAILVVAGLGLAAPSRVLSDHHYDSQWHDDDYTHDRARRALSDGDALPVSELLRRLHERVEGDVVATRYEHEYERWVYEFKIVKPNGNLEYVHMDAGTGEIVDISDR